MPESHLRAADADRAEVADVLGTHMTAGRLTVAEYDERLTRAYAARTYGELAELTADLPAAERPAAPVPPAPEQQAPAVGLAGCGGPGWAHGWGGGWTGSWTGGAGLRAAWASWLTTAVIVIGIWVLTSVAATDWIYPWPVWVIGPWGVVLLVQTLGGGSGGGRDRRRTRLHG